MTNAPSATSPSAAPRAELGAFLRAHRARISPEMAGLPAGTRRRTPGLRREEVAHLAGISATWFTWMEQGRDVSISPHALARLAIVLRLTRAERTYLFDLAGKRDPEGDSAAGPDVLAGEVRAAVETIAAPAYVLDATATALAWNAAAAALFRGWLDASASERNLLRFLILDPAARRLIPDYEDRVRRVVAEFRADFGRHPDDPRFAALVASLKRDSALFARLWDEQAVHAREGGLRRFLHPERGPLAFRQVTFHLAARDDLKLSILVPEDDGAPG